MIVTIPSKLYKQVLSDSLGTDNFHALRMVPNIKEKKEISFIHFVELKLS